MANLYADLVDEAGLLNGHIGSAAETLAERIDGPDAPRRNCRRRWATCGVSQGILPVLAEEASQQWTARFNPRPVTEAEILELYEAAL